MTNSTESQVDIRFSIIEKNEKDEILTKIVGLKDGEFYKDGSQCRMPKGTLTRKTIPLEDLPETITNLKQNQALVHGIYPGSSGTVKIVKKGREEEEKGIISRSKGYLKYPEGPGLGMFDHDKAKEPCICLDEKGKNSYTVEGLNKILNSVITGWDECYKASRPSTSSCIKDKDGNILRDEGSGSHTYYGAKDASDIPRFLKTVGEALVLEGYARIEFSRSGSRLIRPAVDLSVGSPERPDFVAGAICKDGLVQKPPTFQSDG
jgi:hypothetical protein